MNKIKCALVVGTRPEILKIAPIVYELKKNKIEYKVFFTNQHFSKNMGTNFLKEMKIKKYEIMNEWGYTTGKTFDRLSQKLLPLFLP